MAITAAQVGYVAGIVDGEGYIELTPRRNGVQQYSVQVVMTDKDIVERLQRWTGLGSIYPRKAANERAKPAWRWSVHRHQEVAQLLMTIYVLLGERRQERARGVLNVWKTKQFGGRKTGRPELTNKS